MLFFTVFLYTPYSSDLVLPDFWPYPRLKYSLQWTPMSISKKSPGTAIYQWEKLTTKEAFIKYLQT
jgi:hypothetical protein